MTNLDIAHQRLHNQHITGEPLENPAKVVHWLGAVQAQEYAGAKWALALRSRRDAPVTDANVEQAFNAGAILRTHVMRPTWHFVAPEDIRWLLMLTAPRVHAFLAYMYRKCELDAGIFQRSNAALIAALQGGRQLTRAELGAALAKVGIIASGVRLAHLIMYAELEAVICSGARQGKQFTYALLDERAPQARTLPRDEALAELVKRYFISHGPATVDDFAWWSGLTKADTKIGIELAKPHIVSEQIGDKPYCFAPSDSPYNTTPEVLLLPPYDEYTIAYRDHSATLADEHIEYANNMVFGGVIVVNGLVVGYWRRTFSKGRAVIEPAPFRPLTKDEQDGVVTAAEQFGAFLEMPVSVDFI
jgi:hypothetical protein